MDDKELLEIIERAAREEQTRLDLSRKDIKSLPAEIGKLTNLTNFDLSYNQLSSLPPEIGTLTRLTGLRLDGNKLRSLSAEIGKLTNVKTLDLSGNQLRSLPAEIWKLANLKELWLSGIQLSSLPAEIGKLSNLTRLQLGGNQLSSLPADIGKLSNLRELYLSGNQLSSLPAEIGKLSNLRELYLSGNQLSSLPAEIGKLSNLTGLRLDGNQLRSLPAEILDFDVEIKWKWDLWGRGKGISLADNPWERPPVETIKRGKDALRAWFEALEEEGGRRLNEVKVLLVGYGGAGKTSLVRRLTTGKFKKNEPKTHGVKRTDWKIRVEDEDITIHFWDYGGQGIMQATHRVFFSQRCLYILVIDARQESDPEEWLKNIESIGGKSPVLVVINKIDEHPFGLNEPDLERKYPNIKGFHHMSCKNGEGIKSFKQDLRRHGAQVEMRRTDWPRRWARVKERLSSMHRDYIAYSEYEGVCEKEGVVQEDKQKELIGVLHELGVMLHFPDRSLPDMEVLNPEWATEGIYKIINSEELKKCKGRLAGDRLEYVLNKERLEKGHGKPKHYSKEEQMYIVKLMNKFELCYELDGCTILVPDLLTEKEPTEALPKGGDLRFYFEYDFMPALVMPRFMVQSRADLDENLCWRTGAVLKNGSFDSVAVVRQDKHRRRIYVEVGGRQARDYFATIRKTITEINDSFEKLDVTEWVPLPEEQEQAVKYLDLIGHEISSREEKFVGELRKGYAVAKLLGGIERRRETKLHIEQIIAKDKSRIEIGRGMDAGIVADEVHIEIKVEQAVEHLDELKKIVEEQPEEEVSAVVKRKCFEVIHDTLKDVAKRQLSDAAKKIWELGKEVGPAIINTAAYSFFKNILGM